jgi:hypothetical protein
VSRDILIACNYDQNRAVSAGVGHQTISPFHAPMPEVRTVVGLDLRRLPIGGGARSNNTRAAVYGLPDEYWGSLLCVCCVQVEGDEVAVELFAQHLWEREGKGGGGSVPATPATPAAPVDQQLENNNSMTSSSLADAMAEQLTLQQSIRLVQQSTTPTTPTVGQQQQQPAEGDKAAGDVWRAPAGVEAGNPTAALAALAAQMNDGGMRVTGRVVAVLAPSPRRENVVGSLKPENNIGHYWAFQVSYSSSSHWAFRHPPGCLNRISVSRQIYDLPSVAGGGGYRSPRTARGPAHAAPHGGLQ